MPRFTAPFLVLALLAAPPLAARQTPRTLTLEEALELARGGNAGLEAARLRLEEASRRSSVAFTNYLPRVQTRANYLVNNNPQGIRLPEGSLGYFAELGGRFPRSDRNIPQGGTDLFFALTTVAQPLTHYFKIREGRGVALADVEAARAGLTGAEQDVALGVLKAYAGTLLAARGRDVARERVAAAELRVGYRNVAVSSGMAAEVSGRAARLAWLQARQDLLVREGEYDDLTYALLDAIGLAEGTEIQLVEPEPVVDAPLAPMEEYVQAAERSNPELLSARALVDKATHGVGAAKAEYIPEIGLLGAHLYQSSFPFLPKNTLGFGVTGSWTLFDFGARGKTLDERRAQLGQAEWNGQMVEGRVRGQVEAAYRRVLRAREVVALAREALELRTETSRLQVVEAQAGYAVPAQEREAAADRMEAEMDLLQAEMGYRIALAELERAAGTLGR